MIWMAIRCGMARSGIRSFVELAKMTGIKIPTLTQTRRRKPETFTLYEIRAIDRIVHFTDEERRWICEKS